MSCEGRKLDVRTGGRLGGTVRSCGVDCTNATPLSCMRRIDWVCSWNVTCELEWQGGEGSDVAAVEPESEFASDDEEDAQVEAEPEDEASE